MQGTVQHITLSDDFIFPNFFLKNMIHVNRILRKQSFLYQLLEECLLFFFLSSHIFSLLKPWKTICFIDTVLFHLTNIKTLPFFNPYFEQNQNWHSLLCLIGTKSSTSLPPSPVMPKHAHFWAVMSTDNSAEMGIIVISFHTLSQLEKTEYFCKNMRTGMKSLLQNKLLKRCFVTLLDLGSCPILSRHKY